MSKKTSTYWNPMLPENIDKWSPVPGLEGMVEQLTLSRDHESDEFTRMIRFFPDADTASQGSKTHDFHEEMIVISGRLYDSAVGMWLEAGSYTNRKPGEVHGPFKTDEGCVLVRISYPGKQDSKAA